MLVLARRSTGNDTCLVVVREWNNAPADTQDHTRLNLAVCSCMSAFIRRFYSGCGVELGSYFREAARTKDAKHVNVVKFTESNTTRIILEDDQKKQLAS